MNREQRRARKKLNRAEWSLALVELRKTMPKELPDSMAQAQMLMEIIEDEQLNISDDNLAILAGLACMHMDAAMRKLPPARFVNKAGRPVYSEEDIAAFTGQTVEQVRSGLKEFGENGGAPMFENPDDVRPMH